MVTPVVESKHSIADPTFSPVEVTVLGRDASKKGPRIVLCNVHNPIYNLFVLVPVCETYYLRRY